MKSAAILGGIKEGLSPPTRGAWIEIAAPGCPGNTSRRRPPHGGRGLKFMFVIVAFVGLGSPPVRGGELKFG